MNNNKRMQFYNDEYNADGKEYSFATFEESIGGKPLLIQKNQVHLTIPVINQGVYDLKSFNDGSDVPLYFNHSYYLFSNIAYYSESSLNHNNRHQENQTFNFKDDSNNFKNFEITLEMVFDGDFTYGITWTARAEIFGLLVPNSALSSEDSRKYFRKISNLNEDDLAFLLNQNQIELEYFIFMELE